MRRRRCWLAVALLVVAACGDDEPERPLQTQPPPRELRIGLAAVASLDPAAASPDSPSASILADLLYDGLPSLSSSVDEDGTAWTFTLDEGLTFSDGAPVTAADAAASLERVRSAGAGSLPAARLDVVSSIEAVGDSVVVTLVRPMASLPDLLDAPAYGITPAAGPFDGSVGSGPFSLEAGASGVGDVLELAPVSGREVASPGIVVTQYDDLDGAAAAFDAGELDWTLVGPSSAGADGVEATPFQAIVFYGFNLADPLFADERLRQAMAQAIDREAIVEAAYGSVAEPFSTIVPVDAGGVGPDACGDGCEYDVEAARDLLAGMTVPEIPIDHPEGEDEAAVARMLADQLSEVGIPTVIRSHPVAEYPAFAVSGQQGLTSLGWIGVAPTPDDYVDRLFRSSSPDNLVGLADAGVDALLDEGDFGEAEAEVLRTAAIVSLAQFQVLSLATDAVTGLDLTVDGTFDPTTANVR